MNRRRFLIALAVIGPVALLIPAKMVASWRPMKLADLSSQSASYEFVTSAGFVDVNGQTFDLKGQREISETRPKPGLCWA